MRELDQDAQRPLLALCRVAGSHEDLSLVSVGEEAAKESLPELGEFVHLTSFLPEQVIGSCHVL